MHISNKSFDTKKWVQTLLQREFVIHLIIICSLLLLIPFQLVISSYIGIASAIGQTLVIPIVIRSLAGLFGLVPEAELPIEMTSGFLATLDSGKTQNVKRFYLQWWTNRKPKDLKKAEILAIPNTLKCLNHYIHEKQTAETMPAGAGAGAAEDEDPLLELRTLDGKQDPGQNTGNDGPSSNAGSSRSGPSTRLSNAGETSNASGPRCNKCDKYRQLLSDVLQDVLKHQRYTSVMSTSSENLLNIGIRKASTFHQLHEAAILKESSVVSDLPRRIPKVVRNAESEHNGLEKLPESSYKWTWGETLTEKDVLSLSSKGTPSKRVHSGYDIDMISGEQGGEYSEGPSSVVGARQSDQYDDVAPDVSMIPPPTILALPDYFAKPEDLLVYDPFKLPNSSSLPTGSNSHPAYGTNPIDIIDMLTSGSESGASQSHPAYGTNPMDLIDMLTSGSESGASQHLPASHPPDIIELASMWEDDDALPASGLATTNEIAHLADMWEDDAEPSPMGSRPDGVSHHPDSILSLADLWIDENQEEHSGDELGDTSYPDQVPGDDPLNPRANDWSYGPHHFDFLRDEMFDDSDD